MRLLGRFSKGFLSGSALSVSCCAAVWYCGFLETHAEATQASFQPGRLVGADHSLEDVKQLKAARDILKYGVPDRGPQVRYYSGHALAYDQTRKIPLWVAEHITPYSTKGSASRKHSKFKPDPDVPVMFSSTNKDYLTSGGWSRGHMAPAGDFKHDQASMDSTFYLTNVVPQNYENNAGFWNRFEMYCRDLTNRFTDVRIITGPLFLPNLMEGEKSFVKYQVVGESIVAVPTHLYKVVVAENEGDGRPKAVGAFLVPNEPISSDHSLPEYQVPLGDLEKQAGVTFLPLLNDNQTADLCTVDSCGLITKDEFELYILARQLSEAKTHERLDKIWKKLEDKKLKPDDYFINAFNEKKRELEAKEKQKAEL